MAGVFRRQLTPKWRYALWLLVLGRLVLPVSPPSPFSLFNYLTPSFAAAVDRSAPVSITSVGIGVKSGASAPVNPVSTPTTATAPTPRVPAQPEYGSLQILWMGLADTPLISQVALLLVVVVWPLGVLVMVVRVLRQNLGFARQLRHAPEVTDPALLLALEDCKDVLGLDFPIQLIELDQLKSPALFGLVRPRLLLPKGMAAAFTERELRHILLHELAHVKRLDMVTNWLMTLLQTLHWFNPVLRLGFARIRADREVACDALVLSRSRSGEGVIYGETIIKLLETFVHPAPVSGLVGLLEDKEEMKERMTMIAGFEKKPQWSLIGLGLVVTLGLAGLTDARTKPPPEPMPPGLVGWWRAEGNGEDAIGAHNGVLEGRGFEFNGVDAGVKVPASLALAVGQEAGLTVAAWMSTRVPTNACTMVEWNAGLPGVGLGVSGSMLYGRIPNLSSNYVLLASAESLIMPGTLHHAALTYEKNSGMATLYLDAKVVAFTYVGKFVPATSGDLYFGHHPSNQGSEAHFDGLVDEIQVFDRALIAAQIETLYHAGMSGKTLEIASETRLH